LRKHGLTFILGARSALVYQVKAFTDFKNKQKLIEAAINTLNVFNVALTQSYSLSGSALQTNKTSLRKHGLTIILGAKYALVYQVKAHPD
jgi:hypothetical protein